MDLDERRHVFAAVMPESKPLSVDRNAVDQRNLERRQVDVALEAILEHGFGFGTDDGLNAPRHNQSRNSEQQDQACENPKQFAQQRMLTENPQVARPRW